MNWYNSSRQRWLLVFVPVFVVGVTVSDARPSFAQEVGTTEFRVLATSRTSTMEKELNEAAAEGFRFAEVMGGETAAGGDETVLIVSRKPDSPAVYEYRLLATSRTSTMQKELQEAADEGFLYRGQTVFDTLFSGQEVIVILERPVDNPEPGAWEYLLLATNRTSTMEKELQESGGQGFELVGMTVAETALGGNELVSIMRRRR